MKYSDLKIVGSLTLPQTTFEAKKGVFSWTVSVTTGSNLTQIYVQADNTYWDTNQWGLQVTLNGTTFTSNGYVSVNRNTTYSMTVTSLRDYETFEFWLYPYNGSDRGTGVHLTFVETD